jgi:hypothetical protein
MFMIRVVALLVLIAAGFDYCAFDVSDPTAPMNSSGAIQGGLSRGQALTIQAIKLPDDCCLFCTAGISPCPPVMHRATLISFVFHSPDRSISSRYPVIPKHPPRIA